MQRTLILCAHVLWISREPGYSIFCLDPNDCVDAAGKHSVCQRGLGTFMWVQSSATDDLGLRISHIALSGHYKVWYM